MLALLLPLTIASTVIERSGWRKILSYCCILVMGLALLVTSSHGAVLSLILSYLLIAVFFYPLRRKIVILFMVVFAAGILYGLQTPVFKKSYQHAYHSLLGRLGLFQSGWELFEDHFLIGIGRGISRSEITSTNVHNSILTAFLETGIGGGMSFLAILVIVLNRVRKNAISLAYHEEWSPISKGIFISLGTAVLHSQVEILFEKNLYDLFFWSLAGLGFVLPLDLNTRLGSLSKT
jgi:O-antigen ligase